MNVQLADVGRASVAIALRREGVGRAGVVRSESLEGRRGDDLKVPGKNYSREKQ